jgi:hypothetical protein
MISTADYRTCSNSNTSTYYVTDTIYPPFADFDTCEYEKLLRNEFEVSGRYLLSTYFNDLQLIMIKNMEFVQNPLFKPKI